MRDTIFSIRNTVIRALYKGILKPLFFLNDPEAVHDGMIGVGKRLGRHASMRGLTACAFGYRSPRLAQTVLGIEFANPIGLAAGFDKNAELTQILPSVGFGFEEVGSITGASCPGNPKPRLWRLPKSQSLAVYYGLKNDGSSAIAARLTALRDQRGGSLADMPIGISVAMANTKENAEDITRGIDDFATAFRTMEPLASYLTVNISCPNTCGGQPFLVPENTERLLATLDVIPTDKPIFIKLSPDLSEEQLDTILGIVGRHRVHGIICTNLTKKRQNDKIVDEHLPEVGGLSGKVVDHLSDRLIQLVRAKTGTRYVIVGCGGVFTAADAYRKIRLGASLIQLITGMIFEGPQAISEINRGLERLLVRDGFDSVAAAVGVDAGDSAILKA